MGPLQGNVAAALLAAAFAAQACEVPGDGTSLRRALLKVKYLPETEAWAAARHEAGAVVQYALLLDQPKVNKGRCYWPVEVRAEGKLWRRFYVTPDGRDLLRK